MDDNDEFGIGDPWNTHLINLAFSFPLLKDAKKEFADFLFDLESKGLEPSPSQVCTLQPRTNKTNSLQTNSYPKGKIHKRSSKRQQKTQRGPYNCNKCGQLKKAHVCSVPGKPGQQAWTQTPTVSSQGGGWTAIEGNLQHPIITAKPYEAAASHPRGPVAAETIKYWERHWWTNIEDDDEQEPA